MVEEGFVRRAAESRRGRDRLPAEANSTWYRRVWRCQNETHCFIQWNMPKPANSQLDVFLPYVCFLSSSNRPTLLGVKGARHQREIDLSGKHLCWLTRKLWNPLKTDSSWKLSLRRQEIHQENSPPPLPPPPAASFSSSSSSSPSLLKRYLFLLHVHGVFPARVFVCVCQVLWDWHYRQWWAAMWTGVV